ncbi:alpha/beta hydrolase family protein [Streptomyces erythrochromogenes]|uniref:alpha/beta hydrolase family protein n=1 Tax=Streptomyces erythrochromogenes TaxID=285574 RepID=UPI0036A50A69
MKRVLAVLAVLAVVAAGLGGLVVWQNTYELREEAVAIRRGGHALDGVLALPERGRGPFPLVVFVHGDGPVDATHDTFYRPMWEAFARAGYASLSWNKPGVGGAPGDWLDQSMDDRAGEAADAIAYVSAVGDPKGMTAARWRFVSKNHTADASADLPALRGTPVLLVLAGHDVNVDTAETETAYRRLLPGPALRVAHYPDATHSLVERAVEDSPLRLTLTALFAPRALFADGFLTDQQRFLTTVGDVARQARAVPSGDVGMAS